MDGQIKMNETKPYKKCDTCQVSGRCGDFNASAINECWKKSDTLRVEEIKQVLDDLIFGGYENINDRMIKSILLIHKIVVSE